MAIEFSSKPTVVNDDRSEVVVRPWNPQEQSAPEQPDRISIPEEVAVLPVRNLVIFPGTVVDLRIGRDKSRRLIDGVLPDQKIIVTVCQKSFDVEAPTPDDLYTVGTATMVLKLLRLEGGNQTVIVHGLTRVRIVEWLGEEPYFRARVEVLEDRFEKDTRTEALVVNTRNLATRVVQLSATIPDEATIVLNNIESPGALGDFLAANVQLDVPGKQKLLEELDVDKRLRSVSVELQRQIDILELSNKIQDQVRANIDKSQREFFLREQLQAIQKELGQLDDKTSEIQELRRKIESAKMPESLEKEVLREVSRMEMIPTVSPEYNVVRTYLDWMTELPWSSSTEDKLDVNRARRVLDKDHYDLENVKRRILEYLAVRKLSPNARGAILCFVGPPGVGKTSLGQSIARALGRKFIRMSLGGMRDEAELRGHRRTYVAAMPGRVIQEIRKAGTNNPVFMLDELDKVGADFRGDPTSALLEILDPAQNHTFQDHYLNVPFDLSKVMFIGTANYMAPVPSALADRMEVITLSGYTHRQKLQIAKRYLVRRQLEENGLKVSQAKWTDAAISKIIESYTREAGVRELERQIASVCRGVAAMIASGKTRYRTVNPRLVTQLLGPRKYESEVALRTSVPGVATGLAYTPTGGEIIFVEAAAYPGKGILRLTGHVGDVMRESVQAAFSLIKTRAEDLKLDLKELARTDIHVHVPAGGVPKDGPSAGVAMVTALTSLLTGRSVHPDVAMTGEITLRGLVLPVGGVKEKILAAKRAGIKTVVLPERNRKDLVDIPEEVRKDLNFEFVRKIDHVLRIAMGNSQPSKPASRKR